MESHSKHQHQRQFTQRTAAFPTSRLYQCLLFDSDAVALHRQSPSPRLAAATTESRAGDGILGLLDYQAADKPYGDHKLNGQTQLYSIVLWCILRHVERLASPRVGHVGNVLNQQRGWGEGVGYS